MEFRILGPVEVWDGTQRLALGGSKPRALLAVLLLHANKVVSTDYLVDQLWGEASPPTARNLVQVYVSRLRQALNHSRDRSAAAPLLATRSSGYLLRVAPGELDLDRFEELTTQARQAAAEGDLKAAAERWQTALALWRGRRWPTRPRRCCSGPRGRAWRRLAWWRWRSAWRLSLASAATSSWSASWRRWWLPTRRASACASSRCWRCTARAGRPMRWPPTATCGAHWRRSLAWSPARPCNSWNGRSCKPIRRWGQCSRRPRRPTTGRCRCSRPASFRPTLTTSPAARPPWPRCSGCWRPSGRPRSSSRRSPARPGSARRPWPSTWPTGCGRASRAG